MSLKTKVTSGALQFTVFISVIISFLLLGFLLLFYANKKLKEQSKSIDEAKSINASVFRYVINTPFTATDTTVLNLFSNDTYHTKVHASYWGAFQKIWVSTRFRNKSVINTALLGGKDQSLQSRLAICLQETYKPLMIVGSTNIMGKVKLPEQGMLPGAISGEGFFGGKLGITTTEKSDFKLPELVTNSLTSFNYYLSEMPTILPETRLQKGSVVYHQSFEKPTQWWYSSDEIILNNIQMIGNIIIKSDSKIRVDKGSQLKDVILVAPEIEISNQVKGQFQAIANKQINVGRECELAYPSALVLVNDKSSGDFVNQSTTQKITIGEKSVVKGIVAYIKPDAEDIFSSSISIHKTATVVGEVYCKSNLELSGKVVGSVYTRQFIVNQFGSIYINHLYHATIDAIGLTPEYAGLLLENKNKGLVKWLY